MKPFDCRLIVFAKAPIPGRVKSRLLPSLGAEATASLYQQLVLRCLATAVESEVGPVDLWCDPSTEHPFFHRCADEFHVELHLQRGSDLGSRMAQAFQKTLKAAKCALLMGSDCPSLTSSDLKKGKMLLGQMADAVISPTEDGGYALLGLRTFSPKLFKGVSWGSESVCNETRKRLRKLGWRWVELPTRWDVDRPEDWSV